MKDQYYEKALKVRRLLLDELNKILVKGFILSPVMPMKTPTFEQTKMLSPLENYKSDVLTIPSNLCGLPHISFPYAYHEGMPLGAQLITRQWNDYALTDFVSAWEKKFEYRFKYNIGALRMRIGLEVHTGLPTRSKLFCSCRTYVEEPNTAICPICTGMPGSKPMLNREALVFSVGMAKALNCSVLDRVSFVRKVYFYPDLPKSFQITQTQQAVGSKGHVAMHNGKKVGIRRVQLEEDPAKIMREDGYTLIDFNRSVQPLVEIVTGRHLKRGGAA